MECRVATDPPRQHWGRSAQVAMHPQTAMPERTGTRVKVVVAAEQASRARTAVPGAGGGVGGMGGCGGTHGAAGKGGGASLALISWDSGVVLSGVQLVSADGGAGGKGGKAGRGVLGRVAPGGRWAPTASVAVAAVRPAATAATPARAPEAPRTVVYTLVSHGTKPTGNEPARAEERCRRQEGEGRGRRPGRHRSLGWRRWRRDGAFRCYSVTLRRARSEYAASRARQCDGGGESRKVLPSPEAASARPIWEGSTPR